jgi:hypothetical protein
MKRIILCALFLLPSAALFAQAPDCQFAVTFVGAGRQGTSAAPGSPAAFPALSSATGTPCNSWRVSYQTSGSLTVSLSFQGVNAIGLAPGSTYTTMGPACPATDPCSIVTGTNPMTNPLNSFLSVNGYFPFVSLLMNTCGGCSSSSTVLVKIMGYRNGVSVISGGGGGTGTVVGPAMSSDGFVPQWSGTTGTILSAGLPVTSMSGVPNALIETSATGTFPPTFGLVTGPGSSSNNFVPQWVGTSGTVLGAGVIATTLCGGSSQIPITGGANNSPARTIAQPCIPTVRTVTGTSRTVLNMSEIFICTAACTVTPIIPGTTETGQQLCVQNDAGVSSVITLAALATVQYELTTRTGYKPVNTPLVSSGAIGDQICVVAKSNTQYNVFSFAGNWN